MIGAQHRHAAAVWMQPQVPENRACELCCHGATLGGQRHCQCPAVVAQGHAIPVDRARGLYGPCGPEATHLAFKGLRA